MNAHWPEPTRRDLFIASAAGAIWALLGVAIAAHGSDLNPPPSKGGARGGTPADGIALKLEHIDESAVGNPSPVPSLPGRGAASCRIYNHLPNNSTNIGSGTLIDVTADHQRGLILSCAHLFTEGTGRVVVEFATGQTHGANVLAIDQNADLSALEIAMPSANAASVSFDVDPATTLTACGFGPSGQFRAISGLIVGAAQGAGQMSLRIAGAVRSGDSGGGVFDPFGRLVAVVWGESGGETYASSGAPLRSFLERVTGRTAPAASSGSGATLVACPNGQCPITQCPTGRCPLLTPQAIGPAPAGQWPAASGGLFGGIASAAPAKTTPVVPPNSDACSCGCDKQLAALVARLDAISAAKQDRGDFLVRGQLDAYARTEQLDNFVAENRSRHNSLVERFEALVPLVVTAGRAAAPVAATALGISGSMGWAILAATSVGGWLIGRRVKARARNPSSELAPRASNLAPHQEATAAADAAFPSAARTVAETHAPIERDDREARELLRLSQLEGRDPLQDALAGRLALDRLDALAESDADPHRARLADDLRRELRERFNEIAPTKFEVKLPQSS